MVEGARAATAAEADWLVLAAVAGRSAGAAEGKGPAAFICALVTRLPKRG